MTLKTFNELFYKMVGIDADEYLQSLTEAERQTIFDSITDADKVGIDVVYLKRFIMQDYDL